MSNTIETEKETILDLEKIKTLLQKRKFYNFFLDFVVSHDSMKREITEIVAENRNMSNYDALNVRNFRVKEVCKFIKANDLENYFLS